MAYPSELKYSKDHEWVRVSGDTAEIGITGYAQQQLGDVVYVELPESGGSITALLAWDSTDALGKAVAAHGPEIFGDIPNFTDGKPVMQVSEPAG